MPANKHRGEVEIELGGRTFIMRPTPQAVVDMENALNLGVVAICERFQERKFGWRDIFPIVAAGIRASKTDGGISDQKIAEIVFDEGLENIFNPCLQFLSGCLGGGQEKTDDPTKAKVKSTKASTS